jgi:hypothetical protein
MLKDAKAFSGLAVDDVPRAKECYGTVLGWRWTTRPWGRPVAWFRDPAGSILSTMQQ